jgi:hypothetical protein
MSVRPASTHWLALSCCALAHHFDVGYRESIFELGCHPAHIRIMTDVFAKFGWTVEATVMQGPSDKMVQYFLVARETEAEAVAAVRSSFPGIIHPVDEVVARYRLSKGDIEADKLTVDEVRLYIPPKP